MVAASNNDARSIAYLVENGADATARDKDGDSALDYFVMAGNLTMDNIRPVLLAGGDPADLYRRGVVLVYISQDMSQHLFYRLSDVDRQVMANYWVELERVGGETMSRWGLMD